MNVDFVVRRGDIQKRDMGRNPASGSLFHLPCCAVVMTNSQCPHFLDNRVIVSLIGLCGE